MAQETARFSWRRPLGGVLGETYSDDDGSVRAVLVRGDSQVRVYLSLRSKTTHDGFAVFATTDEAKRWAEKNVNDDLVAESVTILQKSGSG